MNSPLQAAYYADRAIQRTAALVENGKIARDTYRARFECPEMARLFLPGQFLMMRLSGCDDPLIGRPLALYDTVLSPAGEPVGIDVVFLAAGKFTRRLADSPPGQRVDVWGPLGNGFEPRPAEHLMMVAGGIGQTPFLSLAKEYLGSRRYGDPLREVPRAARVTLCYGARSADLLAGVEDFQQSGVDVRVSTDDGTRGHHGLVTDVLCQLLAELADSNTPHRIVCCGPEPMMQQVAKIAAGQSVSCQVSLETPMACGIGICFSCVARVYDESGGWDYRRTCVEGPVFDAAAIHW